MRILFVVLLLVGCAPPAQWCWTSGTMTGVPDRDRCFNTWEECAEDAERWAGNPDLCEGRDE